MGPDRKAEISTGEVNPLDQLTERQWTAWHFIDDYIEEHGYPPTVREVMGSFGGKSTSVSNYQLDKLQKLGFIQRKKGISRGIKLLKRPPAASEE